MSSLPDRRNARVRQALARHAVNGAAGVSLAIVVVHTSWQIEDETAERYFGALSDLALAVLAAWIFNLVLVELPKRRQRADLYGGVHLMIRQLAHTGPDMVGYLSRAANVNINLDPKIGGLPVPANEDVVKDFTSKIGPNMPYNDLPDAGSILEVMRSEVDEARKYELRLLPSYPYFDADVIAAINAVTFSRLAKFFDRLIEFGESTVGNENMLFASQDIYEYWWACDHLMDIYFQRICRYVPVVLRSVPWRQRRGWTSERENARVLEQTRTQLASQASGADG